MCELSTRRNLTELDPPAVIIPWNTDAPIYHFPFATIGLIVVNVGVFFATAQSDSAEQWMLAFGDGMHPYQWLTSVFMHADLMHLLGNMVFLWAFGLVIEGKLGWWKFLLVYLGLGIFESAVVQACMQHRPGFALGASGAIYGLIAMALIWAPRNELDCLVLLGRGLHLEIPILGFAMLYIGWEMLTVFFTNFALSSAMLHLAGALPGFAVGIALLKLDLVDCENWDVFAVLQGREGQETPVKGKPPSAQQVALEQKSLADQRRAALRQIGDFLAQGQPAEALAVHERMSRARADWQLSQQQLLELIKALHKQQLWSQSVGPMIAYVRAAPDSAPRVRLKLAQILLNCEKLPGRALSVLEKIPSNALSGDLKVIYDRLVSQAQKAYAEGELEPEWEDC